MTYELGNKTYDDITDFMEDYFREIAIKLLGHSEARPSYFVNSDVDSANDIADAIQVNLKLPALILDFYEDDILSPSDRLTTRIYGSVSIINTFDPSDGNSLKKVRKECRIAARKIVMKMLRDSLQHNDGILIKNKIYLQKDKFEGVRLGIVLKEFTGWVYEFSWEVPDNINLGNNVL